MGIMIGTISTGTLFDFKSQSIKTKFVIIGVPLFPIGSYYKVTNNLGIPIGFNKKSIWVGYSRTTLLAIGILLITLSNAIFGHDSLEKTTSIIIGTLLTLNGIVHWISHWTLNPREEKIRTILSQAFDYNMLPNHLPINITFYILKELMKKYMSEFPESKWEDDIKNNNITENNKYILFALATYFHQMEPNEKHILLLKTMENKFNL